MAASPCSAPSSWSRCAGDGMEVIESPNKRNVMKGSISNGRRLAEHAARWMEGHESEFMQLYGYTKKLQENRIKGRVRDILASYCISNGIRVEGQGYRFDNDLWAGISRYMVIFDPSLTGAPIKFRQSDIDMYGLLPVSWLRRAA